MANILITVTGQSMAFTSMPVIASHGVNEDYVVFTFDAEWTGYAKTATFYHERFPEEIYTTVVNGSNTALVPHEVTDKPGRIFIGVTGVSGNVELTSEVLPYPILPGSNMDGVNSEPPTPELYEQILSAMAEMVGTPLVANTAADMTDTTKIYVYTGSEAGYVSGNWYYWNGSAWVSGGVYNSQGIGNQILNMIYNVYPTEQDAGQIATFKDGADGIPVKTFTVDIEGTQTGTGTPAPGNVCPIVSYDSVNIYHRNKNILPVSTYSTNTLNSVTLTNNGDGTFTVNGTASPDDANFNLYSKTSLLYAGLQKLAGQDVFLSGCPAGGAVNGYNMAIARCGNLYGSTSQFGNDTGNGVKYTLKDFTDETGSVYLRIHVQAGTTADNLLYKPMLTLADETDQTFVAPITPSIDKNIPLGTNRVYKGILNVETGILTATWRAVNMGDGTWSMYTNGSGGFNIFRFSPTNRRYGTDADGIVGYCDCYEWTGNKTLSSATGTGASALQNGQFSFQTTSLHVCVRDDTYSDAAAFKTAMAGHYLAYEYDTPQVKQLTPEEVKTILADNNIWADSGDVDVTIRADIALYISERLGV